MTVTVAVRDRVLTVQDTGVGMTEAELAQAFEPFFRGGGVRAGSNGHGLGLSIVRRLVGQYGWEVHIESEPGQGTLISVAF